MLEKLFDLGRTKLEKIQLIHDEIGGHEYTEKRNAALQSLREGKPIAAAMDKAKALGAVRDQYELESPLSRLQRIRDREMNSSRGRC